MSCRRNGDPIVYYTCSQIRNSSCAVRRLVEMMHEDPSADNSDNENELCENLRKLTCLACRG